MVATLNENIAAYDKMRDFLEIEHFGKWVVFYGEELAGTYDDFQDAAAETVKRFGRGPYLIRQVGRPPLRLPASVQYRRIYADN